MVLQRDRIISIQLRPSVSWDRVMAFESEEMVLSHFSTMNVVICKVSVSHQVPHKKNKATIKERKFVSLKIGPYVSIEKHQIIWHCVFQKLPKKNKYILGRVNS